MRCYTTQHEFYCGIDLHARSMYVCIVSYDGEGLRHRHMKAAPEPFYGAAVGKPGRFCPLADRARCPPDRPQAPAWRVGGGSPAQAAPGAEADTPAKPRPPARRPTEGDPPVESSSRSSAPRPRRWSGA
jgi:hypothetical protein